MRELSTKEKVFVAAYLIELNAQEAARAAKYSTPRINAYRVLARPHVQSAIRIAKAKQMKRLEIKADDVVEELRKIGFANMKDYTRKVVINEDEPDKTKHVAYHTLDTINTTDEQLAAVSEIGFDANGRPKLKLHDKRGALVDLGKHLGIFREDNLQRVPTVEEQTKSIEELTDEEAAATWAERVAHV